MISSDEDANDEPMLTKATPTMCVTSEVPSKGTKVSSSALCSESANEQDASIVAQPEHAVLL